MKRLYYILMIIVFLAIQPIAKAQYVIDKVCKDAVRTYRVDQGNGDPVKVYTWMLTDKNGNLLSIPSGSILPDGSEITITWSFNPDVYTLKVEKESEFKCSVEELGTVEVIPKPFVDAGPNQTVCVDASTVVSLSGAVVSNATTAGIEWTTSGDGSFDNPNASNPNYTPGAGDLAAEKVTLKLTAKSLTDEGDGCLQENEIDIILMPKPQLVITNPEEVCEPNAVDLTASSVTKGSTIPKVAVLSYWTDAAATIALSNPNQVLASGTYYIKVGDNNCFDIQPVTVVVNPIPKLVITNPPAVCEPATIDITTPGITAGSTSGLSFTYWTDVLAAKPLANPGTISSGGIYYIKASDGTKCDNVQPVVVAINVKVVPQFSIPALLCLNSTPPDLPTISNDGFKGTWNPAVISTGSVGSTTYEFTPDPGECAKKFSLVIEVTDGIIPVFANIGPYCQGSVALALPVKSDNNITGTWSPTTVTTTDAGTSDYVFTPDPGQCAKPITIPVTITPIINPTFAAISSICQNAANPLPATSIEGISGTWSPAFSSAIPGTTLYTFTPNAGECANPTTVSITVDPAITATFDPMGPYCANTTAPALPSKSNEGISGTWSPAAIDMNQTRTYVFTPGASQCATSASLTIVINHLDVSVASVTPISSANPTGSIDLAVSGGSGSYSFSWSGPGGFTSISEDISGLAEGNYAVVVTDIATGCRASANASVTKLDELIVRLESTEITCPGGSDGTVTAYISGGTPPYSIQWKNTPAPVATNSNIVTLTGLSKDAYFYADVFDAKGDKVRSAFQEIKESSIVYTIAAISSANPVCYGDNGKIELMFGSGGIVPNDFYDILYDGGRFSGVEISGNRATIPAPPGTYNNIKVEIRGCPTNSVGPVTITPVPALPLPSVEVVQPDCDVATGTIKVITPAPAAGITYTVKGTSPVVAAITNTTGVFPGLSAGVYDITYANTDGCISTPVISRRINVQPATPPNPTVVVSVVPRCIDTSGEIEVKSPIGSAFVYSIDNGPYQSSVTFTNQTPGDHFIRVKNTITTCESGISTIKVPDIPPAPHITNIIPENCLCYGDLGKLNFEFRNVSDGTYIIVYVGGQFNNVKVVNGKASITAAAGIYDVLAIEANGCTSQENWRIEIKQPDLISVSAKITEIDLKSQQKGEIDVTISGGIGPYQTVWMPNLSSGFSGSTTEDIKNLNPGIYKISITDQNNCTMTYQDTIPKPNVPPIATDDEFKATCGIVTGNLLYDDNGFGIDSDPDKDMITIDIAPVKIPSHGYLTINPDGTFKYEAVRGYSGDDTFSYRIYDVKKNYSNPAIVTIHIAADTDGDGLADDLDPDADGDGILNVNEVLAGQDWKTTDSDGDGYPNALDIDSDGDGIVDNIEAQTSKDYIKLSLADSNHNGIDDVYDSAASGTLIVPVDTDADGIPDFLDTDSDNDLVPDYIEGHDLNADGRPDHIFVGKDSDRDGLDDSFDIFVNVCEPSENVIGSNAPMQDFDGDGMKDWRDENDDNDEYLTRFEDLNMDGDFSNDDTDFDGHPEYLDYGRDCDLFVPDAFSPNDDNIHDYFQVYCIDHFPNAQMFIFDQLGNKLFEKNNYGNLQVWGSPDRAWWDGRTTNRAASTNGGKVVPGTYYYVLRLGNGDVRKSFVFVSY